MHWLELPSKQALVAESDGVIRSRAFPGLWIDPKARMAGDVVRCVQVLDAAAQSEEHAKFCEELAGREG